MQALDLYMNRCDEYNQQVDETIKGNSEKLLKSARVLFVEYVFWQECKRSMVDHIQAKSTINTQVKGFQVADIVPHFDIQKCIWKNAQNVVRGKDLV